MRKRTLPGDGEDKPDKILLENNLAPTSTIPARMAALAKELQRLFDERADERAARRPVGRRTH